MMLPNPHEAQDHGAPDEESVRDMRQRLRWAEIMAAARRQIVERHVTGVTMRGLADACGISTQALHGHFGTRDDMISAVLNDYTLALFRYSHHALGARNTVLAFAEAFAEAHEAYPELYSRTTPYIFFERTGARIFEQSHGYGVSLIQSALTDLQRQSRIVPNADLREAAIAVSALMSVCLLGWSRGTIRRGALRRQIISQVDLLFRGLEPR